MYRLTCMKIPSEISEVMKLFPEGHNYWLKGMIKRGEINRPEELREIWLSIVDSK